VLLAENCRTSPKPSTSEHRTQCGIRLSRRWVHAVHSTQYAPKTRSLLGSTRKTAVQELNKLSIHNITITANNIIRCNTATRVIFSLGTCESKISVQIESRIESAATIRIQIKSGVVVYMFQCRLSCGSCVCALATAVELHVKWSCKHKSQLQTAQRLMFFCWTVSERSLWYDGTRHMRLIRNFVIGTSLSNRIRIGTSNSNSNLEALQVPTFHTGYKESLCF